MSCGGGYPLGAEYDSRAPWNQKKSLRWSSVRLVMAKESIGMPTT